VILNEIEEKLELEYPCKWEYKLIGKEEEGIKKMALVIAEGRAFSLNISNKSSSGKFVSVTLEVLVYNDDERVYIYEELRKSKHILYIL
jgi:uncharacterized protein